MTAHMRDPWVRLHGVARELARAPEQPDPPDMVLDVVGAAAVAGVSTRTIMRWLASGRLKPRGTRGRAHLFLCSDVRRAADA